MIIDKNFSPLMEQCFCGKSFSVEETSALIHGMLDDTLSDIRIASVLTAFRFIDITKENILSIIGACREKATPLNKLTVSNIVDCGGTGGSTSQTVHISTMASLVAAAAGARVAKFSGKSLSSKSGSSAVLKFLNISPAVNVEDIDLGLNKTGIVFLDAATFYPSLKNLSDIRKTLGFKTIIDLIFPLANPVQLSGQVVGVYHRDVMPLIISCLKDLGRKRALVVHGEDGQDEISVCSATYVSKLEDGKITHEVWKPADFDIKIHPVSQLRASNLENSAQVLLQVLSGKAPQSILDAVAVNAAGILWCAQMCNSVQEGLVLVKQAIETGKALKTFESWTN
ncbi:MAG: anthranilate phosphoribosyltransferase [Bdellovibrionota bacterium]